MMHQHQRRMQRIISSLFDIITSCEYPLYFALHFWKPIGKVADVNLCYRCQHIPLWSVVLNRIPRREEVIDLTSAHNHAK